MGSIDILYDTSEPVRPTLLRDISSSASTAGYGSANKGMAGIEAKYKVTAVIEEEKHEENGNETEREMACRRSRLLRQHRQFDFRVPDNV